MDNEMPIMDGYEATRAIKKLVEKKELPDIPIIGLSAHSGEEFKQRSIEAGMVEAITKPVSEQKLSSLLSTIKKKHVNIVHSRE